MDAVAVRVVDATRVGPDTVSLTLESPPGFDARPGQFVLVRAEIDGEAVGRHYTLSSPDVAGTFEITVGVDDEGTLSGWLAGRQPGDDVTIEGPFGVVHYEGEPRLVVIAGGPGIGGGLGVAERALADGGAVTLVYADTAFAHQSRLAALARDGAAVYCVRDRLGEAVAAVVGDGRPFVIGFRDFVDEVRGAIAAAGGDPDAAKVENFGPR